MSDYQILMLMDLPANPITGGEIYNYKIYEYLRARSSKVEKVPMPILPHRSKLEFFLNSIRQNLSMLGVLGRINGETIIFEDISSSSDLFIFNLIVRHLRGLLGKKIRIVPIVHQVYAPLAEEGIKRSIKSLEENIFLNSSDRIIVNSEFTKRSVQSLLRGEKDMVIAYPGLNVSSAGKGSKGGKSRQTSKDPENLHLLFVGYITPRKGVDTLVESFKILVKDYGIDNLILDVVGDASRSPDLLAGVERYSQDAGIQDRVKFHGRVSEDRLEELYSLADIFIFPSIWEGFGMVLIEAMHNRLPIVTTDAGAIPFLVKDGVNGFLVPVKDAEKLAQATRKLIESPQLRREIGETNYKVADQFRWEESLSKIKKFLDEAFDAKNKK
jgi:glycosyltransferase involved in cell wall biosynthesis